MAQLWVKCPGCPGGSKGIGPGANQADLVRQLESHIQQSHGGAAGGGAPAAFGASSATGQDTGSTFWAPWYVGENCHS